jgi:hypothetical protein
MERATGAVPVARCWVCERSFGDYARRIPTVQAISEDGQAVGTLAATAATTTASAAVERHVSRLDHGHLLSIPAIEITARFKIWELVLPMSGALPG